MEHKLMPPSDRFDDRAVHLRTADGMRVVELDPAPLMEPDGRLPNIIQYDGRTYERGWTNDGNTDADERFWFEAAP